MPTLCMNHWYTTSTTVATFSTETVRVYRYGNIVTYRMSKSRGQRGQLANQITGSGYNAEEPNNSDGCSMSTVIQLISGT